MHTQTQKCAVMGRLCFPGAALLSSSSRVNQLWPVFFIFFMGGHAYTQTHGREKLLCLHAEPDFQNSKLFPNVVSLSDYYK